MIVESGVIIFIGLMFMAIKLPRRTALWLLGRPLTVDLCASGIAYVLHWGTFSGVMAAAVAGLMCSGFTIACRYLFGYIEKGKYHVGVCDLSHQLRERNSIAR